MDVPALRGRPLARKLFGESPNFLQQQHVRLDLLKDFGEAFSQSGAQAVDVPCRNFHLAIPISGEESRMVSASRPEAALSGSESK